MTKAFRFIISALLAVFMAFASIISGAVPVVAVAPTQGLLAYWSLNDGSGTTALDSSGHGNSGSLNGNPAWSAGQVNGGLTFNGSNYVKVTSPASFDALPGLTVSAWVNSTDGSALLTAVSRWQTNTPSKDSWILGNGSTSGKYRFVVKINGSNVSAESGTADYGLNTWRHLVGVYDGTAVKLYINGVLKVSTPASGALDSAAGVNLNIGSRAELSNFWKGGVDEVRFYNRALSTTEISDLYTDSGSNLETTTAPVIASFNSSPAVINQGESATLTWSVSGNPTPTVSIDNGVGSIATTTSVSVSPTQTTTYTLTATNSVGTVTSTATVVVNVPNATSTPAIISFVANPASVNQGSATVLSWGVSGNPAPTLSIDGGIGTVTGSSVTVTPATGTVYTLTATNDFGTTSQQVAVSINPPDTSAPSMPGNVSAGALSTSQISIIWSASTDNVGVIGYNIYRNGTFVGTSASPSYIDTGLQPGTSYSYTVAAFDAAGNVSTQSSTPALATTNSNTTSSGSAMYVNVKDYGVKADAVQITDITTTDGSTTASSATRTFSATDVGKLFSCAGAGASGGYLNTKITAVSGKSVTLEKPAGATLSGTAVCRYGTDDAPAIQTLVNSKHNGVTLFFPAGNYAMGSALAWFSNTSAIGAGVGKTVMWWMSTSDQASALFNATGNANNLLTNIEIAGFEFDGSAATQATYNIAGKAIAIIYMDRPYIHDNYAHDWPATCIGPDAIVDGRFERNILKNCGRLNNGAQGGGSGIGISMVGLPNEGGIISHNIAINNKRYGMFLEAGLGVNRNARWIVDGNKIENTTSGKGIGDAGSQGIVITNNSLTGPIDVPGAVGISVDRGTTGTTPGVEGLIANNQVDGFDNCIALNYFPLQPTSPVQSKYKISENKCSNAKSAGIAVTANNTQSMNDVEVSYNTVYSAGSAGIEFSGTGGFRNVVSNGNMLIGNGRAAQNTWQQAGIAVNGNMTKWIAKNNTAYDGGSNSQLYGISASNSVLKDVDIQGNNLENNLTSQMNLGTATVTGWNFNNQGPSGNGANIATTNITPSTTPVSGTAACWDGKGNLTATGCNTSVSSSTTPVSSWSWAGPSDALDAGTVGTTETPYSATLNIPANAMSVGTTYRATVFFQATSPDNVSSRNYQLRLKKTGAPDAGTLAWSSSENTPNPNSTRGVGIDVYVRCLTAGTNGTVLVWSPSSGGNNIAQPITVDTTSALQLQWTQSFGSATSGNTDILLQMGMEKL